MYKLPDQDQGSSWMAEWDAITDEPVLRWDLDSWARWSYLPGSRQKDVGQDRVSSGGHWGQQPFRLLIGGGFGVAAILVLYLIQKPSEHSGFGPGDVFLLIFALIVGAVVGGIAYGVVTTADRVGRFHRSVTAARRPQPITLGSLRDGPADEHHPDKRVSPEGKLVTVATQAARTIQRGRAWKSNHLDTHRVRLDLAEEVRQLADRAMRLYDTRRKLGSRPSTDSPTLPRAATLWDEQSRTANLVLDSLVTRLGALISYRNHVDLLSRELDALDAVCGGDEIGNELTALLAGSVADEQAAAHLHELTAETQAASPPSRR